MTTKTGRYSGYIRPFSYLIDFVIVNVLSVYIIPLHEHPLIYALLISFAWFIIAVYIGFYEVYRYTRVITILNKSLKQAALFGFFCLLLEMYYSEFFNQKKVVLFVLVSVFIVLAIKLFIYYFLRRLICPTAHI